MPDDATGELPEKKIKSINNLSYLQEFFQNI